MNFLNATGLKIGLFVLVTIAITFVVAEFNSRQNEIKVLSETVKTKDTKIAVLNKDIKAAEVANKSLVVAQEQRKVAEKKALDEVNMLVNESTKRQVKLSKRTERFKNIRSRVSHIALNKPKALARLINERNAKLFKRVEIATSA